MYLVVNKKKALSDLHMSCLVFLFGWLWSLLQWTWNIPIKKVIEIFYCFATSEKDVRFKHVPWKSVWFRFISIVWVHFSHKTEKFWFWKSLKDILMFFNINIFQFRNLLSDQSLSRFFLFYLYILTLLYKKFWIKNAFINFKIYWNTLMKIFGPTRFSLREV